MGGNPAPPEIEEACTPNTAGTNNGGANGGNAIDKSDQGLYSIRDRLRFKRNPNYASTSNQNRASKSPLDRHLVRYRWHHSGNRSNRKGPLSWFPFQGAYLFYFVIFFAVFAFVMASVLLQSSITAMVSGKGWSEQRISIREGLRLGSTLRFVPGWRSPLLSRSRSLDPVRYQMARVGLRPPRLAVVLGNMKKDAQSLMLVTVLKNLRELGYALKIFAVENGNARPMWEQVGGRMSILGPQRYGHIDWSIFEGVIVDSLEAKGAISSLMQEPFCSIPLIWIIQEDLLGNRLQVYERKGWKHLVSHWRTTFKRANVVVFPDFTLPMLYSVLDSGNFFVVPGSPVDVWAAESYSKTHAKHQLRLDNGYSNDDMVVLVVGSFFFYDQMSWDHALEMDTLGPLLAKHATINDAEESFKFVFLCGNSTDVDALQQVTSHLGLLHGSVRHYGLNGDVNSVLLMADIVIYGSSLDEQGFPPLIIRAMTFGIPVVLPDLPIFKKYVVDGRHGIFFARHNSESLMMAFSLLVSDGKISKFAQDVASFGRQLAKNMLASECATGYARLLEILLSFPSDALLPGSVSQLQQKVWEWNLTGEETEWATDDLTGIDEMDASVKESSVVYSLEEEMTDSANSTMGSENGVEILVPDVPNESDSVILEEIESFEDYERLEVVELEERMDRSHGVWDEIYQKARKSEKLKFEANERDEGELERTGQPVCIYEIYNGAGSWFFLHHGSLYRGLSLSMKARRPRSDDVDAVSRLPILNDSYYQNLLCEMGGMFSIANKVDSVHGRPWIGFQSWRAAGRKVSLSIKAEKVLEEKIQKETRGDVMYFWARLGMDDGVTGSSDELTFWSMCDILNAGRCRTAFEDTFRHMYSLPSDVEGLPPMPEDGGHWSTLHSWIMPMPSFLEFIMFSRYVMRMQLFIELNSPMALNVVSNIR
uniref:Uncharacterized protein MANES_07G093200 n=1 Tax=Rhizophora mucronata TaxID=61149 RepID=A0A2P2MFY1_RHIMU